MDTDARSSGPRSADFLRGGLLLAALALPPFVWKVPTVTFDVARGIDVPTGDRTLTWAAYGACALAILAVLAVRLMRLSPSGPSERRVFFATPEPAHLGAWALGGLVGGLIGGMSLFGGIRALVMHGLHKDARLALIGVAALAGTALVLSWEKRIVLDLDARTVTTWKDTLRLDAFESVGLFPVDVHAGNLPGAVSRYYALALVKASGSPLFLNGQEEGRIGEPLRERLRIQRELAEQTGLTLLPSPEAQAEAARG